MAIIEWVDFDDFIFGPSIYALRDRDADVAEVPSGGIHAAEEISEGPVVALGGMSRRG